LWVAWKMAVVPLPKLGMPTFWYNNAKTYSEKVQS
jgi:hypothetical protein